MFLALLNFECGQIFIHPQEVTKRLNSKRQGKNKSGDKSLSTFF